MAGVPADGVPAGASVFPAARLRFPVARDFAFAGAGGVTAGRSDLACGGAASGVVTFGDSVAGALDGGGSADVPGAAGAVFDSGCVAGVLDDAPLCSAAPLGARPFGVAAPFPFSPEPFDAEPFAPPAP